jgi:hypothetical protein
MIHTITNDPKLLLALIIGFILIASLLGGLLRAAMIALFMYRIFFIIPFLAGSGGALYLLQ